MNDLDHFKSAISARFGLAFDGFRSAFLAQLLAKRLEETGSSSSKYLRQLETDPPRSELLVLAAELTVGETYFFRNDQQLRVVAEVVVPRCKLDPTRPLRILSAGCASGEEPFSLAMTIRPLLDPSSRLEIVGVDLNPAALERAARGRFSSWSLRETSPESAERWFTIHGREFELRREIRDAVRFAERNLMHDDPQLFAFDAWDVIFCRNVLMYFSREAASAVVRRFQASLKEDGFLFLGHAETLRGLSTDFHLRHTHETFYYQPKRAAERADSPPVPRYPLFELPELDGTWVEVIQRASDRIQSLSLPSPIEAVLPGWDPREALALLERERFADAIAEVERMKSDDPDALLLHAALLVHSGRLEEAETLCRRLLQIDELDAAVHYVRALCREAAADREGAVECDQTAVHLDPTFAMPHLHLGLLHRRAGVLDAAEREVSIALSLLATEEPSRVLLFGGGFKREALIAMCRAELARGVGTR